MCTQMIIYCRIEIIGVKENFRFYRIIYEREPACPQRTSQGSETQRMGRWVKEEYSRQREEPCAASWMK